MSTTITSPKNLEQKVFDAAKIEGYKKTEDFILQIIEDKLTEISDKYKIIQITNMVRDGLASKGVQEEDIIEDFEKFRYKL